MDPNNLSLSDRLRPLDMAGAGLYTPQPPRVDVPRSGPLPTATAAAIQQAPAPGPVGLMRTLGAQPPVPAQTPQTPDSVGLLPPQLFLPQPMTPGQTLAASFAGGVSAMHGRRNPVLDQYAEGQEQQRRSVQTAQRWMDARRRRQMEDDDNNLRVGEALLKSDNEAARSFGAQALADWARRRGIPASPDWFVHTSTLPEKDLEAVNDLVYAGVPDAEIIARYPKVTPAWLQTQRRMLANPQVADRLGYKRPDDPAALAEKREAERVQNWVKSHPDFKDGGDLFAEANARFRKATGRDITTSTKDDEALLAQVSQDARQALNERAAAQKRADEAQKRADRNADAYQRGLDKPAPVPMGGAVYDKRTGTMYSPGVVSLGDLRSEPSRYRTIAHSEVQLLDFLETTGPQLDLLAKATKELLAINPGANLSRQLELAAKGKLAMSPELTAFFQANADLALEMARALSGGGQLRVTVLKYLREDVIPTTSDTVATANTKINLMRQQLENRRRGILGEKVGPLSVEPGNPSAPKAGTKFDKPRRVRDPKTGRTGTLPAGEPLPPGVVVLD